MDINQVKELAQLMKENGLTSVEITEGETSLRLYREPPARPMPLPAPIPMARPAEVPPAAEAAPPPQPAVAEGEALTAPLVGIGYVAAEPGAKPFVTPGSRVKQGQCLCIIEAMKVMNEFCAPRDGEITEVCFKDGDLLEFGQCLFRLR